MFLIHILYFQLLSFFSFTVSYIFHIYLGWIHLYITCSTANIQIKKIGIFVCSQQDTYVHIHSLHITWFNAYLLLPYLIHVNVHYTINSCHICRSIDEYFRSKYTFLVARGATMKITQYVHKVKEWHTYMCVYIHKVKAAADKQTTNFFLCFSSFLSDQSFPAWTLLPLLPKAASLEWAGPSDITLTPVSVGRVGGGEKASEGGRGRRM